MFSSRLHWQAAVNPIARALARRQQSYLDLTQSNPTQAGIEYPADILSGFGDAGMLQYEPRAFGLPSAREQVAALHGVDAGRVVLTASSSEAYAWLFKLLADPGDEVLAPRPSYPLFEYLAALESVRVVHYPLHYDHGWLIDCATLEERITARTRAVIVVNPNNPTGSYLKRDEVDRLAEICGRHGLALISDEVFSDYAITEDARRVSSLVGELRVPTFCLNGLSKMAGLPQMKLGWMVVGGPGTADALEGLEWIADTYLSVGAPVQFALPALLRARVTVQSQIRERLMRNLAALRLALDRAPAISLWAPEGGWYATLQVPRVRSEEQWVLELLEKHGVLVQPGHFYDFEREAFLVVSLLTEPGVFDEGVARVVAAG